MTKVEVSAGVEPETGDVVVVLRVDDVVLVLDPVAASMLADRLKVEAAYALVEGANARWTPPYDKPGPVG